MREIKFRCWFDGKMHGIKDINFYFGTINLVGADIINFDEGILMQYIRIKR